MCVGGPLDGKEIASECRFVEAMEEDGRIAKYEARLDRFVMLGHFVLAGYSKGVPVRDFVPLVSH